MSAFFDPAASKSASDEQDPTWSSLRCEPCDKTYTTERALQRHTRESAKHSSRTCHYRCKKCSKQFVRAYDYRRHVSEQHGQGKVECPRCGKVTRPGAPHYNTRGRPCSTEAEAEIHPDTNWPLDSTSASKSVHQKSEGHQAENTTSLVSEHNALSDPSFVPRKSSELVERPGDVERVICNLCEKPFEERDSSALRQHLDKHLHDFRQGYECVDCEIVFVHQTALQEHLSWAHHYNRCGLPFRHQSQCTGHHRPQRRGQKHLVAFERDRFQFCLQLRELELAQLQTYLHRVNTLICRYGPPSQESEEPNTSHLEFSPTGRFGLYEQLRHPGEICVPAHSGSAPITSAFSQNSAQAAWEPRRRTVAPQGNGQTSVLAQQSSSVFSFGSSAHRGSSRPASSAARSTASGAQSSSNVNRAYEGIRASMASLVVDESEDDSSSEDTEEETTKPTDSRRHTTSGENLKHSKYINPNAQTRTPGSECDWTGILGAIETLRQLAGRRQEWLVASRRRLSGWKQ